MAALVSVAISNEPGALAKVASAFASGGINIDGLSVLGRGNMGEAHFLVKDGPKAVEVLATEGFMGKTQEVFLVDLSNHPGALADACARLASAGVNIQHLFGTAKGPSGSVALLVDDVRTARKVLNQ